MPKPNRNSKSLSAVAAALLTTLVATSGLAESPCPEEPCEGLVWVVSESPEQLVEDARKSLRSGMRGEMIAALEPGSPIWAGGLDGGFMAEQMRIRIAQRTAADMVQGVKTALTEIRLEDRTGPSPQKAGSPRAAQRAQLAGQFGTAPQAGEGIWP